MNKNDLESLYKSWCINNDIKNEDEVIVSLNVKRDTDYTNCDIYNTNYEKYKGKIGVVRTVSKISGCHNVSMNAYRVVFKDAVDRWFSFNWISKI